MGAIPILASLVANQYMDRSKIDLLELPIGFFGKVCLYLVMAGQKPAAEIFSHESVKNESGKIRDFLKRERLFFRTITIYDTKDEKTGSRLYLVSQSPLLVLQLKRIWNARKWGTKQHHLKHGLLVGFPRGAVWAYANTIENKEEFTKVMLSTKTAHGKFDKEPWGAYLTYVVRRGYEEKDVKTAKRWAKTVRDEFPKLASEFEKWAKTTEQF